MQELWWHLSNPADKGLFLSTYCFCLHFHTNTSCFLLTETWGPEVIGIWHLTSPDLFLLINCLSFGAQDLTWLTDPGLS